MPTAVITGCNNGIGYALAKVLLKEGYKTYATSRTNGPKLKDLADSGAKTAVLDVASMASIAEFKKTIGDEPVDVLINNAAIATPAAVDVLNTITPEGLNATLQTNLFGPLFLTQSLLPNILSSSKARIGHITSRAGSIADNGSSHSYAYRTSKAGLNMIGKCMALDLKKDGVVVAMLHPGMVPTGATGDIQGPQVVPPEEAAEKMWKLLSEMDVENTGKFWHREGYELPW